MNTVDSRAKRLPPFGREVRDMIFARRRPVLFGGAILVSLDWHLGDCWSPRLVFPPDTAPAVFDLSYLRGCEILVIHRPEHPPSHVDATLGALRAVPVGRVVNVALPRFA
jgi:hypothetical protein